MPRINCAIELLARDQPVYYTMVSELTYLRGLVEAHSWADYLTIDLEHQPFDMAGLHAFMAGLVAGGPTASGHRTPCVVVTLPMDGSSADAVHANRWMIQQALAAGVHGLLLCHAECPEAVSAFVEGARYPFRSAGVGDGLGEGRRGSGGQHTAARTWGIPVAEYLRRADPWPLDPAGELMLGLKIENRRALERAEACLAVPGIAFAEWGPGDMGMSLGHEDAHDPPWPADMLAARSRVRAACDRAGVAFLDIMQADTVTGLIDEGVRIGAATAEVAAIGRRHVAGNAVRTGPSRQTGPATPAE